MAFTIALAVGLFIVICGSPALKSSQIVPDGLVYTEVKKTLVRGVQGVLTCRFYGKPIAVYWEKGFDPDDLSLMVIWHDGEVSGPRFDDGSCNVDENYSLIINNVSAADAGRINCKVSNYKGILIKNYTDIYITDTALATNPQVTLQMRQATYGILQCTVHIRARRVTWKRGTVSSANESLVALEINKDVFERSGAGYDEELYNITHHYSLVIKEVQVHHEGLYICEVTDFDTGISFRSQSFVNVVAQPLKPFPTIQECLNTDYYDSNYCTLVAESGITLTCEAVKYYPAINLRFIHGSRTVEPLDTREWNNTDGTINKTLTIAAIGSKELYTCVASNIPGTSDNKSTSVLLHDEDKFQKAVLLIILILFAVLTLISSVACFIWRKKHRGSTSVPPVSYSAVPGTDQHQDQEDSDVNDLAKEKLKTLDQCVNSVLMKYYSRICDATKTKSLKAEQIFSEIGTALFDSQQMLTDLQQRQTSSSYQYLRAFQATFSKGDKSDPASDNAWPSNEELKSISCHLTHESMREICKKLKIAYSDDDANDEGKRFDSLCEWRTKASDKSFKEKFKKLSLVLGSNNLGGLLPTLRGPCIYKAELIDLAFHLLIHDLLPITEELGINATKLVSYRPAFHSSHLAMGTIKLLMGLKVDLIYSKIVNLHYKTFAIIGNLEYNMSYGELYSISEAINENLEGRADRVGYLQIVLQLTDQDIANCFDTSHTLTTFALFKIWKEKPRPSVFNYRAALAHELRTNGMPGLADEIIAGTYITEQTSLAFIEDMVQGLNQDDIGSLGKLLRLSGGKKHWNTSTTFSEISNQIYDWVAHWTTGMRGSWFTKAFASVNPGIKTTAETHRDLNDQLVEHGFLDLAREIMIIEQQLARL